MAPDVEGVKNAIRQKSELAKLHLWKDLTQRVINGEKLTATELKTLNDLDRRFSETPQDQEAPEYLHGYDDAIAYLGISKRALQVNIKKGNIRQEPDGTFKKTELDNYLEKSGRTPKADITELEKKKLEADVRFRELKVQREEILLKEVRGQYFSKKQVVSQWANRLNVLCASLDNLADRLPPILYQKPQNEMHLLIRKEIDEFRTVLCRGDVYCPAPKPKGRPRKVKK